jgi:hypothetical protein
LDAGEPSAGGDDGLFVALSSERIKMMSNDDQMSFEDQLKPKPRELPRFKAGDRVRVIGGPLEYNGAHGIVLKHLDALVSVELDEPHQTLSEWRKPSKMVAAQWTNFYADELQMEARDAE